MNKIGLFFGTDTGNTERIANEIKEKIENTYNDTIVEIHEIYKKTKEDILKYDKLIIGMPTWYDGELQADWESFLPIWEEIDFSNKTLAFFGLGDQYGYSYYFCDALGMFYHIAKDNNASIIGDWSKDSYDYDDSKAEIDGVLVGLCIDVDNQDDLTDERLDKWLLQIKPDME